MKNDKIIQVAKYLLTCDDYVTIQHLAEKFQLSQKTIRNYMDDIAEVLKGVDLLRIPGQGIKVKASQQAKGRLLYELDSKPLEIDRSDKQGRFLYLLYVFLVKEKYVTMGYLEDHLYISRPSIYKDLERVKSWFEHYDIELCKERKIGFYLQAGEKRIRLALFDWLLEMERYMLDNEYCSQFVEYLKQPISYYEYLIRPESYYRGEVQNILEKVEKQLGRNFSPIEYNKLSLLLSISVKRVSENHFVTLSDEMLKLSFATSSNDIFSTLQQLFNQTFQMNFPAFEIAYYSMLMMSSSANEEMMDIPSGMAFVLEKQIAHECAALVYKHYKISDPQSFEKGLAHHIKNTLNKLVFGNNYYNPMKDSIMSKLPKILSLTKEFIPIFEKYCDVVLPDDELAYLALHICTAIEKSKIPLKTVLVYSRSYSEGKFAAEYLQKNFAQISVEHIYSEKEILRKNILDCDLLISQKYIELDKKMPQIIIPPIIGIDVIEQLALEIAKVYEDFNNQRILIEGEDKKVYLTY